MDIKIKKGLDLKIDGAVEDLNPQPVVARRFAVVPDDYHGFVPRLDVAQGDHVMAGQPLMHDKDQPSLCLVAPVSGTVAEVVRGDRRKLLRVVIEPDGSDQAVELPIPETFTRENIIDLLGRSGLLALLRRRPFDTVVRLDAMPRDIFVTALDTAPLAVDPWMLIPGDCGIALSAAIKALKALTTGKVYVATAPGEPQIDGAEMLNVSGPHPAGNVGTHIAAVAPINKGETVWTLDLFTLYKIGQLLTTGHINATDRVCITGPEVAHPGVVLTKAGADVASLLEGRLKQDGRHVRIVSGNVLTGTAVEPDGFLRWPYRQITVIAEGDDTVEFMGWASLSPRKMSTSRSFPGHFLKRLFSPDARLLGGRRAMIMSGQFDSVMPLDVMPEYLLRAIIGRDIDEMEKLGIYEVAPEDFALAEYVDTSKMPLQRIVRDGLDYLSRETE